MHSAPHPHRSANPHGGLDSQPPAWWPRSAETEQQWLGPLLWGSPSSVSTGPSHTHRHRGQASWDPPRRGFLSAREKHKTKAPFSASGFGVRIRHVLETLRGSCLCRKAGTGEHRTEWLSLHRVPSVFRETHTF